MARPLNASSMPLARGWRARAWAWVLFLALFKGLVPHAALAAVLMPAAPALLWCDTSRDRFDGGAAETPAGAPHCVCTTSAADAAGVPLQPLPSPRAGRHHAALPAPALAALGQILRLPPPRGPPSV